MKKMILGLVFFGSLFGLGLEARNNFGSTFGGTFLGTTGGVVLGNAISGSHRHRSNRRGREYCEKCRYLEDRNRDLENQMRDVRDENRRLRDKLDDYSSARRRG